MESPAVSEAGVSPVVSEAAGAVAASVSEVAVPMENNSESQPTTNSPDPEVAKSGQDHTDLIQDANGGRESEHALSAEEVKNVLEIVASTGKFWHDWDELKSMLSFQLKQVLSEYPEAMKVDDEQNSPMGESFAELAKRLEEVLCGFIEGPPFTLQRLSEILLDARAIYPNLSKLALAIEKNLLVTSTLTKCTDPYPSPTVQVPVAPEEQFEDAQPQPQSDPELHPIPVENGGESMTENREEAMLEVEAQVDDSVTMDVDTFEEIITSSDSNPEPAQNS